MDSRFEKQGDNRCDQCGDLNSGMLREEARTETCFALSNEAGAFCHRQNMPPAGERKVAWERGDWEATWYFTECYMKHYFDDLPDDNSKHKAVCEMLGFTERAAKKARHAASARAL